MTPSANLFSNFGVGQFIDPGPALTRLRSKLIDAEQNTITAPQTMDRSAWPPDYKQVQAWRERQLVQFETNPALGQSAKKWYATHPVEFINHWVDTYDPRNAASGQPVRLPLVMFRRQAEMADFIDACMRAETSGLIEKTRDMGATWVACARSVHFFLFGEPVAIGWGSQTQDKVDRLGDPSSCFEKMRMILRGLPKIFVPDDIEQHLNYMRCVNPETGATIVGEIGDNIGRGGRTLVYIVDEAAHLARPEKVEASLSDTTRCRIDISSVSGLGTVFYRKRESGVDWIPGEPAVKGRTNVFVMDWRDHPLKTDAWYNERREDFDRKGLPHVFAQEIDRNYSAAAEGVIIPAEWVVASIDAHVKLGFKAEGVNRAGLDVADGSGDTNALATAKGPVVMSVTEWSARDTGVTARTAVDGCRLYLPIAVQYDCIGVGSGVKAETNRLQDDKLMPKGMAFMPWNAGGEVQDPLGYVNEGDKNSPRNKEFFYNVKAQAWWSLRRRFELTFQAVNGTLTDYDPEELISLPSNIPLLRKLQKELSQATASKRTTTLKLVVDKSPEGTKSPNLADALVMAYFPIKAFERHVALGGFQIVRQR